MPAAKMVEPKVPLFTYITVPTKSDSADDAELDHLPEGIPEHKLQDDGQEDKLIEEKATPPNRLREVLIAHGRGECSPCAYFWQKQDGCRQGEDCNFCHICDKDAMRRWKKEKKQKKKAEALAVEMKAGSGKKKKKQKESTAQKSASTVKSVIGDPVHVLLADCRGLSASTSKLGRVVSYLPMEVRLTPCQAPPGLDPPPGLDLGTSITPHADMAPKFVENFAEPDSLRCVFTIGQTFKETWKEALKETSKAAQDEPATYRQIRLGEMWPELAENSM